MYLRIHLLSYDIEYWNAPIKEHHYNLIGDRYDILLVSLHKSLYTPHKEIHAFYPPQHHACITAGYLLFGFS